MKAFNPFSLDQWIIWLVSTGIAGITGTVGMISYAEKHYASKGEVEIQQRFTTQNMEQVRMQLDKLDAKLDRLLEKGNHK